MPQNPGSGSVSWVAELLDLYLGIYKPIEDEIFHDLHASQQLKGRLLPHPDRLKFALMENRANSISHVIERFASQYSVMENVVNQLDAR